MVQDEADAKAVADMEEASWDPPADQKTSEGLVEPSLMHPAALVHRQSLDQRVTAGHH